MKLSRRTLLISAIAAATLGGTLAMRRAFSGWLHDELETAFGPEVAEHAETGRFMEDVTQLFRNAPSFVPGISELPRQREAPRLAMHPSQKWNAAFFIELFARSTNVVHSDETGEALIYDQLFLPAEAACSNQLASGSDPG